MQKVKLENPDFSLIERVADQIEVQGRYLVTGPGSQVLTFSIVYMPMALSTPSPTFHSSLFSSSLLSDAHLIPHLSPLVEQILLNTTEDYGLTFLQRYTVSDIQCFTVYSGGGVVSNNPSFCNNRHYGSSILQPKFPTLAPLHLQY